MYSPDVTAQSSAPAVLLYSTFSWGGLRGNVTFSWLGHENPVIITVSSELAGNEIPPDPVEYNWSLHPHPVKYDGDQRCEGSIIGKK